MSKGKAEENQNRLSPAVGVGLGLLLILVGAVPVLAALGIIPSDDAEFNAPRWLVAVLAGIFPVAGIFMLLTSIAGALGPKSFVAFLLTKAARSFAGVAFVAFFVALAVFCTWELFAPYPGKAPPLLGRIVDRFGWAAGALVFDLLVAMMVWQWIKMLLGIKSPPSSHERPTSPR